MDSLGESGIAYVDGAPLDINGIPKDDPSNDSRHHAHRPSTASHPHMPPPSRPLLPATLFPSSRDPAALPIPHNASSTYGCLHAALALTRLLL